ncbi:unnamed protein product [marine sediment metagenome]|uniref:DUF8156 domain-containing protein n=1 Tax=marine sediment metagenome TaxID=412755 RepID=X0U9F3_9ZZZZ
MGRTLPSYRRMLEKERTIWQTHYANRLREPYRTSFTDLWLYAFQLADAASANTRPIVFDNVIMSMVIGQHAEIQKLKDELDKLRRKLIQITK